MKSEAIIILIGFALFGLGDSYYIELTHDGPVVLGATITFKAVLFNSYGEIKSPTLGTFEFVWRDDAIPRHETIVEDVTDATQYWNISYPASKYSPGPYEVEVVVKKVILFPYTLTSQRVQFNVTANLNGKLELIQNNATINMNGDSSITYVANNSPVSHSITLAGADYEYLSKKATQVLTYWFVDCMYFGQTEDDKKFIFNYNGTDKVHDIEALIVASFDPIPTPAPITTTTTTTSTTPATTTTSTAPPLTTSTTSKPSTLSDYVPFLCLNTTIIPPDPNKTIGYFHRKIESRAPVANVTVKGNYWLKHGDMLNLSVNCAGSPPYTHCLKFVEGAYNVTGNETCNSSDTSNYCEFPIYRYFRKTLVHTIVIIISNDVKKIVHPVTINIYEVTKKAQLSVVVVPVAFTLVAVILIVFGVAFYVQSRRRFTVEVADFDFGQANDLEYKTFSERLREAFFDAFPASADLLDSRSEPPASSRADTRPIWRERNRSKYGNVEDE